MPYKSNEQYGIIIQARTGSTRLPCKVLNDIDGKPMLLRQAERLRELSRIRKLIVATSDRPEDDKIEALCKQNGFNCFRGNLNDVMARFIDCAHEFKIDYIIRVTGDDPLVDPKCCNHLMDLHQADPHEFMYASNRAGWPYGCAADLIELQALDRAHKETLNPVHLEHTVPYFYENRDKFSILQVNAPINIVRPNYYLTVDYEADILLVRQIFKLLENEGDLFPLESVIHLLDHNLDLLNINSHLHRGFDI
ncbi:cytidylyltransferase domain-containing protein [Candidatus Magnetominusculus dajiuhuensis]|uniref:cytidylyltransferase domain-containing protein n=1 Tax=Candidatus Magnetominusculus dajiuhuensis TaxID=3137712 RepID=UPI003B428094